jgi:hypothetical protein
MKTNFVFLLLVLASGQTPKAAAQSTGTFTPTGKLRVGHTATLLADGRVLQHVREVEVRIEQHEREAGQQPRAEPQGFEELARPWPRCLEARELAGFATC